MTAWADGLISASLQGGVVALIAFLCFRALPRIPGSVQAWIWRLIAFKFLLGLAFPIVIFDSSVGLNTVSEGGSLPTIIVVLSCVGFSLSALSIWKDWIAVRELNRHGIPVDLPDVDDISARFGLRNAPVVLLRDDIERPILSGSLRPTIHLPSSLSGGAAGMVLAHECAHIKRRDLAWEWLFVLIEAIFFFHPVVRLIRHEYRMAQENACDAMALKMSNAPVALYGKMLLDLSVGRKVSELALTANMVGSYGNLRYRILRLKAGAEVSKPIANIVIAMLGIAALPTWRSEAQPFPQHPGPNKLAMPIASMTRIGEAPLATRAKTPKEGRP